MSSDRLPHIAVIGAGAWGTALALLYQRAGKSVALWARDEARGAALAVTRRTPRLRCTTLPEAIDIVCGWPLPSASEAILLAVPVQHLRTVAARLPAGPTPLVGCAKGMEVGGLSLPLDILAATQPGRAAAVLSGPNFAAEIAAGKPAAAVIACADPVLRQRLVGALAAPGFRLYGNDDPLGVQLGAAAKNVFAIAAGAVIGAGLGENARAALITRALAELARLVLAQGGRAETVTGLSGLGDLLLTATGPASRNFSLGLGLGRGHALSALIADSPGIAEGVATAPALAAHAAQHGIEVPIIDAVAALLACRHSVEQAIAALLARPPRDE